MIPVVNILQGVTDKLNKLSNLQGQFIPDETVISAANRAQNKLILKKIGLTNNYQLGLDSFKKRYEDLEVLIVTPYQELTLTKTTGDLLNSYNTTKPTDFLLPIDMYVLGDKGNCKDRIIHVIETVKHGDLQDKLKSSHYTPSFAYQETIATISGNTIFTYVDSKSTFTLSKLYLSYLRTPLYIDITGYTHLDNTPSVTTNCELASYLEEELLNLIVEELGGNTGNQEVMQIAMKNSKSDE